MAKVFISYQRRPSAILATYLHEKLQHYGIEAYVDTRRVDTGGHFPDRLVGAIEASDVFVCLVADTTFESDWVRREIEHACKLGKTMIPVFQESYVPLRQTPDAFIEELLQSDGIQILDTRNVFIDESVEQLARMIRKSARRRSSPVRPLLAIGVLVLALLGGGIALLGAAQTPAAPTSTPTETPVPTASPIPTASPLPTASPVPTASPIPVSTATTAPTASPTPGCPSALPTLLTVPGFGRVRTDDPRLMNVRLGPSTDFRLAGQISPGEVFTVLEGPQCAGVYAWYRIRYGELEGWIAEGDTTYFVEPYTSPTPTPP
jgi:hypothetical protein